MLILTRNKTEKVMIGNDIVVTMLWCGEKDGIVRLGIDMPKGTDIRDGIPDKWLEELHTKTVEKPVIKYKKPMSRLIKRA